MTSALIGDVERAMRIAPLLAATVLLAGCGAGSSSSRQEHHSGAAKTKCSKQLRVQERGQPFARVHCGALP